MNIETDLTKISKEQRWYKKLDQLLLYLLAAELGYFILLIFFGVFFTVLNLIVNLDIDFFLGDYETSFLWPILFYILALPLNMFGGFTSIVLNIRVSHEGYPGTGHLLNWIFLMTTGWLFILSFVFIFPPIATGY